MKLIPAVICLLSSLSATAGDPIAVSWAPLNEKGASAQIKGVFDSSSDLNQKGHPNPLKVPSSRFIETKDGTLESLKGSLNDAFALINSEEGDATLSLILSAHGFGDYLIDQNGKPYFYGDLIQYINQQMDVFRRTHDTSIEVKLFANNCFGFPMDLLQETFPFNPKSPKRIEVWAASKRSVPAFDITFSSVLTFMVSFFHEYTPVEYWVPFDPSAFLAFSGENQHDYYSSYSVFSEAPLPPLPLQSLEMVLKETHPSLKAGTYHRPEMEMAIRILSSASDAQAAEAADILLRSLRELTQNNAFSAPLMISGLPRDPWEWWWTYAR